MSKQNQMLGGGHVISQLLTHSPHLIKVIYFDESANKRLSTVRALAEQNQIPIEMSNKKNLDKLLPDVNHQGVVANIRPTQALSEGELFDKLKEKSNPLVIVLDEIQDPHNLGAILRSACAFNVDAVVAPVKNACPMTATVRKIASGGDLMVPYVQVTNLARWIESIQSIGFWVIGTTLDEKSKPLPEHDLKGSVAIVLGSEGKGLRQNTLNHCDFTAFIPMNEMMESLNVSVACGITLYESYRQKHLK